MPSAARRGDAAKVKALLDAGADPNDYQNTYSALMHAAGNGHLDVVRLLLEHTRDLDRGFAAAVWGRHADLAMRLAERGADINAVDSLDRPALAGIVVHPGTALLDWFVAHRVDLARHGGAALHAAASAGRADLARLLLDANVPVDLRGGGGVTALLLAAGAGQVEVVRLLLERGAELGAHDQHGRGIDEYMQAATNQLNFAIKKREASRAYHPTGHLKERLPQLAEHRAEIKLLLAR